MPLNQNPALDFHKAKHLSPVSFKVAILIVTLPLLLSLAGFGAKLLEGPTPIPPKGMTPKQNALAKPAPPKELPPWLTEPPLDRDGLPPFLTWLANSPMAWLQFLGKPEIALLVPTGLAFWLLGLRRGLHGAKLGKVAEDALRDVGSIAFLFAAAGGFKEVIQATEARAQHHRHPNDGAPLSPVGIAYVVGALMCISLGSATAAIITASAILQGLARQLPGQETLLVLAVANGVIFLSQPADSGFWMIKEYGNLTVRETLIPNNGTKIIPSLTGLALLLIAGGFGWPRFKDSGH